MKTNLACSFVGFKAPREVFWAIHIHIHIHTYIYPFVIFPLLHNFQSYTGKHDKEYEAWKVFLSCAGLHRDMLSE